MKVVLHKNRKKIWDLTGFFVGSTDCGSYIESVYILGLLQQITSDQRSLLNATLICDSIYRKYI